MSVPVVLFTAFPWTLIRCWVVARAVKENKARIRKTKTRSFKYFLLQVFFMKPKTKEDKFWAKLKEWQKDPEFRKGIKEFVKKTTS